MTELSEATEHLSNASAHKPRGRKKIKHFDPLPEDAIERPKFVPTLESLCANRYSTLKSDLNQIVMEFSALEARQKQIIKVLNRAAKRIIALEKEVLVLKGTPHAD